MAEIVLRRFAERYGLQIERAADNNYLCRGIGLRGVFSLGVDPELALARLMLAVSTTPTREWVVS